MAIRREDMPEVLFGGIEVRACSAATMVIGRPGGVWWHPGSQTPCEHEGEPQTVRWVSAGRCGSVFMNWGHERGKSGAWQCDRDRGHEGHHAHNDGEELVKW